MSENAVGFIFCRGGSKAVPRKNLRLIAGKPLLGYAIEAAQGSQMLKRVIVSTDDDEIAQVARSYGAEVPFRRPTELAQDDSPELEAWRHAIKHWTTEEMGDELDVFVSVPATSPLRVSADIDRCVEKLIQSGSDIVFTLREAARNPYFNMLEKDSHGSWDLCKSPSTRVNHRQSAPSVFEITTVAYAARPAFVMAAETLFDGKIEGCIIPEERAIDIDSEHDLMMAECLMRRRSEDESVWKVS